MEVDGNDTLCLNIVAIPQGNLTPSRPKAKPKGKRWRRQTDNNKKRPRGQASSIARKKEKSINKNVDDGTVTTSPQKQLAHETNSDSKVEPTHKATIAVSINEEGKRNETAISTNKTKDSTLLKQKRPRQESLTNKGTNKWDTSERERFDDTKRPKRDTTSNKQIKANPKHHVVETFHPKQNNDDAKNKDAITDDKSSLNQPTSSTSTTASIEHGIHHQPSHQDDNGGPQQTSTAERAAYLARYHAHPKELDRRNGTLRTVPKPKSSDHLFPKDNHHDDNNNNNNMTWESLGISNFYRQRLTRLGYKSPTTIQIKSCRLPNHRRVLIHSETGSGKTLAYLLPIVQHTTTLQQQQNQQQQQPQQQQQGESNHNRNNTTNDIAKSGSATRSELSLHCLIVVPTRELAYQIYHTVTSLTAGTPLVAGVVVGAEKRSTEKAKLRKGLPIVIGTLGRIMDHLESTQAFDLTKVHTIVLDEVDRLLLDRPEVIQTLFAGAVNVQSLILVSATCDSTVTKFTEALSSSSSSSSGDWHHVRETTIIPQHLQMLQLTVHAKYRFPALMAILGTYERGDTVVFCSTCAAVDYYHALFQKKADIALLNDLDSLKLHGNMELADRTQCLVKFRSVTTTPRKILWTTDVAARGLNLSTSSQSIRIVQYDPPTEISDYLHRAGRTARAGEAGTCLIFTLPTESQPFAELLRDTTTANANILLPISLNDTLERAAKFFPDLPQSRTADAVCFEITRHFEQIVYQYNDLMEMARAAFLAHIRAYAVKEKALKSVFVARGLHLGHVARSFLLKEPPTSFSAGHDVKKKKTVVTPQNSSRQRKNSQLLFRNATKLEGNLDGF